MRAAPAPLAPELFLPLAGHPLRWRLLTDLARSDWTVRELTQRVEQPQSLVSYHLGKLRDGGLVTARRSSADRRDSYYSVDLTRVGEALASTGAALHPALRRCHPVAPAVPAVDPGPARLLFLCTGNSARSQMAEAFVRVHSGGRVEACSAGSSPKPLHQLAVRVMREDYGIDISDQRPKHLDELAHESFDRVISLCDRVREVCPEFPGATAAHWSLPDPAAGSTGDGDAAAVFQQVAGELQTRVRFLLADLTPADRPVTTTAREAP